MFQSFWKKRQFPSFPPLLTWQYGVASLLLGTVFARGIAALHESWFAQKYSHLVVGDIAWDVGVKNPDYLLLLGFVVFSFAFNLGLRSLAATVYRINGSTAELGFRETIAYTLLPAGIWVGNIFIIDKPTLELILLAIILLILACLFAGITILKRFENLTTDDYVSIIGGSVLTPVIAALSSIGLVTAIARLNLDWQLQESHVINALIVSVIGSGIGLSIIWGQRQHSPESLKKNLRFILGIAQCFLPLMVFVLIPAPWTDGTQRFHGYSSSPILYGAIWLFVTINFIDISRRFLHKKSNLSVFSILSPLSLIALLTFSKSPIIGTSFILPDDYHLSESVLPWWLFKTFGYLPYVDYDAARGLVNYIRGFVANLFFDGTIASYVATAGAPETLLYYVIFFPILAATMGALPAFLSLLLFPRPDDLYSIDLMVTIGICVLAGLFVRLRPIQWLVAWFGISLLLILYAPGQGGLFTISMLPFAGWMVYRSIREQPSNLVRTLIAILAVVVAISIATPLDQITIGTFRYAIEQSSLNSVSYGIQWYKSTGSHTFLTYPLWEFIRTSWIVVSVVILCLVYQVLTQSKICDRKAFLALAVPLLLFSILLIPRAAGRIDIANSSRLGIASIWAACLAMPIVFLAAFGRPARAIILLATAFLGGVLNLASVSGLDLLIKHPTSVINTSEFTVLDGDAIAKPNMNGGIFDPFYLQRLLKLDGVISTVLEPNETYLDLMNGNTRYFYLNYAPPMPATIFNLVHPNQQKRTLDKMTQLPTPLVITAGAVDPSSSVLRTPILHRYVMDHFIPFKMDDMVLLIHRDYRDRLNRLETGSNDTPSTLLIGDQDPVRLTLLDQIFHVKDVRSVPSSWGRSLRSLQSSLQPVQPISGSPTLQDVTLKGENRYQVTGSQPQITFDLSALNINGEDASLLGFDFTCKHRARGLFELHWNSQSSPESASKRLLDAEDKKAEMIRVEPRNGPQLMPLDVSPRWVFAKEVKTLTFQPIEGICRDFSLSNLQLYQRTNLVRD